MRGESEMKRIRNDFRHTKLACYICYVSQAAVCVFLPLLFVMFNENYGISIARLTLLTTVNFSAQFITDCASMLFVDKIGYRKCAVAAQLLSAAGFVGIAVTPWLSDSIYTGIFISVLLYSVGGGLLEVLISPIIETCPSDNKAASMSLLHSMFSFGSVFVILFSTLFFAVFGKENWQYLSLIWAVIPLLNSLYFTVVPIRQISEDGETIPVFELFKQKSFWIFALIMLCSGASEQGMSQWASAFAESSLNVSKAVGDVFGPCMFAITMGFARAFYPKISHRVKLTNYIIFCAALCVLSYLMAVFSPLKFMALAGCGLCGFAVGIMWPGTISLAAEKCSAGGTALFAAMALAGDLGCTSGPTLVGAVSSAFGNNLKAGLLAVIVFPVLLIAGVMYYKHALKNGTAADKA